MNRNVHATADDRLKHRFLLDTGCEDKDNLVMVALIVDSMHKQKLASQNCEKLEDVKQKEVKHLEHSKINAQSPCVIT